MEVMTRSRGEIETDVRRLLTIHLHLPLHQLSSDISGFAQ